MNLWIRPAEPKKQVTAVNPAKQHLVYDQGRAPYSGHAEIATADNLFVATGADVAAAQFYADRWIVLRHGALLIADSKDGKPIAYVTKERLESLSQT